MIVLVGVAVRGGDRDVSSCAIDNMRDDSPRPPTSKKVSFDMMKLIPI